jgi:hypothetical protein
MTAEPAFQTFKPFICFLAELLGRIHGASMSIESPALTAVANNKNASDATLSRIANHPYTRDAALAAIARHRNASSVTLNNVAANHYASQATRESVQRRLAPARTRAGEHYHNYQGQGGPTAVQNKR